MTEFARAEAPDPAALEILAEAPTFDGGEPEVIAYLYGGQGTINVPSWSPDSEHVAFISNTGM